MKQFLMDPYLYHFRFHFMTFDAELVHPGPIPFHELLFVLEGTVQCQCDSKTILVEPGHCLYLAAGTERCTSLPTGCRVAVMNFYLYRERLALPRITRLRNMEQMLFFLHAFHAWNVQPDPNHAAMQEVFFLIVSEVARSAANLSFSRRVEAAKEYISEHLSEELSVDCLSRLLGLNRDYFGQLFRRHEGCSVREYIAVLRIRKAMSLLQIQTLPIKEIASQVGFHDPFYFMNVFKKMVGLPPAAYRKAFRRPNTDNLLALSDPEQIRLRGAGAAESILSRTDIPKEPLEHR